MAKETHDAKRREEEAAVDAERAKAVKRAKKEARKA